MISKIEKIKTSIDTFNDAEFFTFGEQENQIIVKSLNDGSLWALNYIEAEGEIVFDTEKAEKIKDGEPSEKQLYKEEMSELFSSLKGVFSEDADSAIEKLKIQLRSVPKQVPTFEEAQEEKEYEFEGEFFTDLAKNVKSYYEAKKDFEALGSLFEGSEIKRGQIFDPLMLLEANYAKQKASDSFLENVQLIVFFKEKLETLFEDKDIAEFVTFKMDLRNPKVSIPKALVLAKKQYAETEFNVASLQKEIAAIYEETFAGSNIESFMEGGGSMSMDTPAPFIYNQVPSMPQFRYLKFRTGAFNEEALNALQKELQYAMSRYSELSQDELKLINEMSTRVQYMQLTGQIDDQLVVSIIESFNRAFKKAEDYKNSELQLGFKAASERDARNFNRGTSNVPQQ
jgi:hypothetical protein